MALARWRRRGGSHRQEGEAGPRDARGREPVAREAEGELSVLYLPCAAAEAAFRDCPEWGGGAKGRRERRLQAVATMERSYVASVESFSWSLALGGQAPPRAAQVV